MGHVTAVDASEVETWKELLSRCPGASVFSHCDILSFLARRQGARAELVAYEEGEGIVLMPWMVRPVRSDGQAESKLFDAVGPDYSGPVCSPGAPRDIVKHFLEALLPFARNRALVTAFVRLDPFAKCQKVLTEDDGACPERPVICVDLSGGFAGAWKGFRHSARKNYKRAMQSGLTFTCSVDARDAQALATVYEATMNRRQASARFRLGVGAMRELLYAARDRAIVVTAWMKDKAVASTLYLHGPSVAFSYLGGALSEFSTCRPTNGVVAEAIKYLTEKGVQRLILGGGYRPGDGIERFKRTLSPLERMFRSLRLVFDEATYRRLCSERGIHDDLDRGYFPAYRQDLNGQQP